MINNNNYNEFTERVSGMGRDTIDYTQAILNYELDDPHGAEDLLYQNYSAPVGNYKFYNTTVANPMKKNILALQDFPDYSDEVLSDYKLAEIMGKPMEFPDIIDLDTSPDYVDFIKKSIITQIQSENEFNVDAQSGIQKILDIQKLIEGQ